MVEGEDAVLLFRGYWGLSLLDMVGSILLGVLIVQDYFRLNLLRL
jgi:hypothetical protein